MEILAASSFALGVLATVAVLTWRPLLQVLRLGGRSPATAAPERPAGITRMLDVFEPPADTSPDELGNGVLVRVDGDGGGDIATVMGPEAAARRLGEILGQAPLTGIRLASTGVQAALDAAEATGHLVRLSPESAGRFKELEKITTADGWVLATLRNTDTKTFAHTLRIRPLTFATHAANMTGLVSAIAMQAQLDAIERSVAAVGRSVDRIHESSEAERWGRLKGAERLIGEVYSSARSTGSLTGTMWEQIAPLVHTVYALQEEVLLRLQDEARHLRSGLPTGAKSRADEIDKIAQRVAKEVAFAAAVERSVVQFQLLRLWRLQTVDDPSMPTAVDSIREQLESRTRALEALRASFIDTFAGTDVVGWVRKLRTKPREEIRRHVEEMRTVFDARLDHQSSALQSFVSSTSEPTPDSLTAPPPGSSDS